jgi:hypothetical protein
MVVLTPDREVPVFRCGRFGCGVGLGVEVGVAIGVGEGSNPTCFVVRDEGASNSKRCDVNNRGWTSP